MYNLGIDIGGTAIKYGVVAADHTIIEKGKIVTRTKDGEGAILGDIAALCKQLSAKYDIPAVGVGSPGCISEDSRYVVGAGNLPFENTFICDYLERELGKPVFLENDGNAALIGEKVAGEGQKYQDIIMLTIGTGIGGGIMIGGKIYHGHNNRAGELGHFVINCDGPDCPCGLNGCFEKYASAAALVKQAASAMRATHNNSLLAQMVGGDASKLDGKVIFAALDGGCDVARGVIYNYMRYLAIGINSLIKLFQPELFVLAGGITGEGQRFMDMLRPRLLDSAEVAISRLRNDAGLIGASELYNISMKKA